MLGCLVGLYKCPGVSLVGVGETWRQMLAKYMLLVIWSEAKEVCGMEKLYGGLKSGIEGGIHTVPLLWQKHAQEEDWTFILVDAYKMCSMKRATQPLFGQCTMSGPVVHSFHLTATATRPHW